MFLFYVLTSLLLPALCESQSGTYPAPQPRHLMLSWGLTPCFQAFVEQIFELHYICFISGHYSVHRFAHLSICPISAAFKDANLPASSAFLLLFPLKEWIHYFFDYVISSDLFGLVCDSTLCWESRCYCTSKRNVQPKITAEVHCSSHLDF